MIEEIEETKNSLIISHLAEAFKRYLLEQIGPIDDKPLMEAEGWIIALQAVEFNLRKHLDQIGEG